MFKKKLPTFVRGADNKFYQDLVYQDTPLRRAWFICFSDEEPAEIVVRESLLKGDMSPRDILRVRGFNACLAGIMPGRLVPHLRFFGMERDILTGAEKPIDGHKAVSFFLSFKKGVALPTPNANDSCIEIYPFFPNKPGIYFGDQR